MRMSIRSSILVSFGVISLSMLLLAITLVRSNRVGTEMSVEISNLHRPARVALQDSLLALEAQSGELGEFLQTHTPQSMARARVWGDDLLQAVKRFGALFPQQSEERHLALEALQRAEQLQALLPEVMQSHTRLHDQEQVLFGLLHEALGQEGLAPLQVAPLFAAMGALTGQRGHETDDEQSGHAAQSAEQLRLDDVPPLLTLLRQSAGLNDQRVERIGVESIAFIKQRDHFMRLLLTYREEVRSFRAFLRGTPLNGAEQNLKQMFTMMHQHHIKTLWLTSIGMGIVLLVSLLLGYYVLRRVGRPVETLIEQTRRLASGDFSLPPVAKGDDEIAILANHFSRMVGHLRSLTVGRDFFESTLDSLPDGVIVCDRKLDVVFINSAATHLLECRREDVFKHNLLLLERRPGVPLVDRNTLQLAEDIPFSQDVNLERARGGSLWCHMQLLCLSGEGNLSSQCVITLTDVTALHDAQEHMRLSATVFETTNEAILITDRDGNIEAVNPAFERITGYAGGEVVGKSPHMLSSGRHDQEFYQQMWEQLLSDGRWQGEIWNRRKNGGHYVEWLSIASIRSEGGAHVKFIGVFSDITRRKETEQMIEYQARYDALTDLPNRRYLEGHGSELLKQCREQGSSLSAIGLDLDGFKRVNDRLGHAHGDLLLRHVASTLKRLVDSSVFIARMGGDEFCLLLQGCGHEELEQIAASIVESLHHPIRLKEQEVRIGCSLGIATLTDGMEQLEDLMRCADVAMYYVKTSNKNDFAFFDAPMRDRYHERQQLELDLARVIDSRELQLVYQPIVDSISGRMVSLEALIRWNHPIRGPLLPELFIPLAERNGHIYAINEWVLNTATQEFVHWRDINPAHSDCQLNVNISALHFIDTGIIELVDRALKSSGLEESALRLEITEGTVIQDRTAALANIHALGELGVSVALDDFGTGYSSLAHLREFTVGQIKIDQSFVEALTSNEKSRQLVQSIIEIARSLNLEVVAEGVETREQLALLEQMGCHNIQGYLYARPAPIDSFRSIEPFALK